MVSLGDVDFPESKRLPWRWECLWSIGTGTSPSGADLLDGGVWSEDKDVDVA